MAKKKQAQPLVTPSTAKKPSEVASPVKKPSEVSSTAKKPSDVASTSRCKKEHEPVKIPPLESSSDEEEDEESGSEEEEEEDVPSKEAASASAPVVVPSESSESESESENESDGTDCEEELATTKTTPPPLATPSKRQSEGGPSTDVTPSKRAKKETESGTETAKKSIIQRIWSEDDEIVILQGMINYRNNAGNSYSDDMNGFFESLNFESRSVLQLTNKIGCLKNKYLGKTKKGFERSFTRPHDLKCLELCKMVWSDSVVETKKKIKVEDDVLKIDVANVQSDWFESSFLVGAIVSFGQSVDEDTVKEKWKLLPVKAKKKIEEKWKLLKANEMKCVLLKTELIHEVSSQIFG